MSTINRIRLETSSYCQLRCPSCPTTVGAIDAVVGKGFLSFENFKKIVDDNPDIKLIELSNYGEIFLNPELSEMMKYAFEKKVALTARNGVNLNNVKEEVLENLVKYQFLALNLSVDGASQETYSQYRIRGNFDRVMDNVKKIIAFKRKYRSELPKLSWQYIVFGHNEHEIPKAREMADSMGIELKLKLSWDDEISPLKDPEFVKKEVGVGAATRAEYEAKKGSPYKMSICRQLWDQPMINWNGDVLGCCQNFWGTFGSNAFEEGLDKALLSGKLEYARQMLQGNAPAEDSVPCTTCDIYRSMKATGSYLKVQNK